jgi:hypothetical protein
MSFLNLIGKEGKAKYVGEYLKDVHINDIQISDHYDPHDDDDVKTRTDLNDEEVQNHTLKNTERLIYRLSKNYRFEAEKITILDVDLMLSYIFTLLYLQDDYYKQQLILFLNTEINLPKNNGEVNNLKIIKELFSPNNDNVIEMRKGAASHYEEILYNVKRDSVMARLLSTINIYNKVSLLKIMVKLVNVVKNNDGSFNITVYPFDKPVKRGGTRKIKGKSNRKTKGKLNRKSKRKQTMRKRRVTH